MDKLTVFVESGRFSLFSGWAPVPTWAFAIVVVGAFTLFFAFLPGFITTVKTKDTSGMSWVMWLVSVLGLLFLVIFYGLGLALTSNAVQYQSSMDWTGIDGVLLNGASPATVHVVSAPHFIIVFVCELGSLLLSIYIFVFKIINMQKSKALGISEAEYCARLLEKKH